MENTLIDQPLTSNEQNKIIIFILLLAPAVVLLVGIVPAFFLAYGIFMMKRLNSIYMLCILTLHVLSLKYPEKQF